MQHGCKISFPTGYYMKGDPATKYIQLGHESGSDGVWDMNEGGVKNAIVDSIRYELAQAGDELNDKLKERIKNFR